MKKAYIFPGQGSQFPGMAKDLYENVSKAKEMFEQANEILGFRITDIMFGGSAEDLKETKVTQPAIFLHSSILASCYAGLSESELKAKGLDKFSPDMVAGHSLGEYSALFVSGAIKFEDALRLVSIRAKAMQKCCEQVPGTMAAIIALSDADVEQICMGCDGIVVPANYNCEGQIVISGDASAVEEACRMAKNAGAKRAIQLPVSGAFHSPLMEQAREELGKAIKETEIVRPLYPIYQNVSANAETEPDIIKENLFRQLTGAVRWTQSVKSMISDGATSFLEIGPGTVLQGLVNKIVPAAVQADKSIEVKGLSTIV